MAGYLYACHPGGDLHRVKIGFTTSCDPEGYCHKSFGRTLCPLHILRVAPTSNARLAEGLCHHLLAQDRLDSRHEVFDLSSIRDGMAGEARLDRAIEEVHKIDSLSGTAIPVEVDFNQRKRRKEERAHAKIQRQRAAERKAARKRAREEADADREAQRRFRQHARELPARQQRTLEAFCASDVLNYGQGLYTRLAAFRDAARAWAQDQGLPEPHLSTSRLDPIFEAKGLSISKKGRRAESELVTRNAVWLDGVTLLK